MEILHINFQISRMGALPASLPGSHSIPPYLRWKTGIAPWRVGVQMRQRFPSPDLDCSEARGFPTEGRARKECHGGTDQQFPVGIINQHQNSWPPVGKRVVRGRKWKEGGSEPVGCRSVEEPFLLTSHQVEATVCIVRKAGQTIRVLRASSRKGARVSITHHPDFRQGILLL